MTHDPHEGKGYGENDIKYLWKRMTQIIAGGGKPDTGALLNELDERREGGAPAWRQDDSPRSTGVRKAGAQVPAPAARSRA
jgi:hypothetical protein